MRVKICLPILGVPVSRISIVVAAALSAGLFTSAALAADLARPHPIAPAPAPIAAPSLWDGGYVGVFAGYGAADWQESWLWNGNPQGSDFDPTGGIVGVDAGFDFTVNDNLVLGVVGDIAWTNIGFTLPDTYTGNIDWIGSLRARIGVDAGKLMPYLTAGLAVAGVTTDYNTTSSATHMGWTAGGGVELSVADNVSIDLQYRYSDYGSQGYNVGALNWNPPDTLDYDIALTTHQVSAGVNWRF
jgi:outer membrane immunogenic protein